MDVITANAHEQHQAVSPDTRSRLSINFLINSSPEEDHQDWDFGSTNERECCRFHHDSSRALASDANTSAMVVLPILPSFATIAALSAVSSNLVPSSPRSNSFSSPSSPPSSSYTSSSPSSPLSHGLHHQPLLAVAPCGSPAPSADTLHNDISSLNNGHSNMLVDTTTTPTASVSELLEGLLRTMGPRAFADDGASSSPSDSGDEVSPSSAHMRQEHRGRRKGRRQASSGQVGLLEEVFALEPIPTALTKARLSQLLDMPTKRIQIWFKNKRARQKKGRPRREPFTFHYFASRASANRLASPAKSPYRPLPRPAAAELLC